MAEQTTTEAAPARQSPAREDSLLQYFSEHRRNTDWLIERRRQAWQAYNDAPLPSRVVHLWRYTDPALFGSDPSRLVIGGPHRADVDWPAFMEERFTADTLAGGVFTDHHSSVHVRVLPETAERGVWIASLPEAARNHPELIEQYFCSLVDARFGKFEAAAEALWTSGTVVFVPRGVQLEKPIYLFSASPENQDHRIQRLLVIVEDEASVEIVDEYGDGTGAGKASVVSEIIGGQASRVKYVPVQRWSKDTISYMTQRMRIGKDGVAETALVSLGAGTGKVDCGAILSGPGANSHMFGLAIGDGKQHYDHHTVHYHEAGHTYSDLKFKAALHDRANSVYTGLIRIDEAATECEAYQENRNLLLSPKAKAESIPELEILNKDVRCSHGATVGKLDPEEIFYLESRGIPREDAIRLIVRGFVAPMLQKIPTAIQDRLEDIVTRRISGEQYG